jgi:acyl-[acyl-carrier-protein] desaturase
VALRSQKLVCCPKVETALYTLYRDYFDQAERRRRWSLSKDVPWHLCNSALAPVVADVVESFLTVELYLPDYVANAMSVWRSSRACAWFYANWGYEESKHSLALGDWLLLSGQRTEEQMADLQGRIVANPWDVPHDNAVGMLAYAMVQELATGLTYRNLRRHVEQSGDGGDPTLATLLGFLGVDEQAHYNFFLRTVRLFLDQDRPGTLRQLQRVLHNFAMPVIYDMKDGPQRVEAIKALGVFDDQMYFHEVYTPILTALGVSRPELRQAA